MKVKISKKKHKTRWGQLMMAMLKKDYGVRHVVGRVRPQRVGYDMSQ